MVITGYTVEVPNGEPFAICWECFDDFEVEHDKRQVKSVETSQYQHGTGTGKACTVCGFEIFATGSGDVVKGKTDKSKFIDTTLASRSTDLEHACVLLEFRFDGCHPALKPAPGESATEIKVAEGSTVSFHGNITETLVVEEAFLRSASVYDVQSICEDRLNLDTHIESDSAGKQFLLAVVR